MLLLVLGVKYKHAFIFKPKIDRKEVDPMLFSPKEKGQGLVEYALIIVLLAIVVIAALTLLGPSVGNMFSSINASIP